MINLLDAVGYMYHTGVERFTVVPKGERWDIVAVTGEKGTPLVSADGEEVALAMASDLNSLREIYDVTITRKDGESAPLLMLMVACIKKGAIKFGMGVQRKDNTLALVAIMSDGPMELYSGDFSNIAAIQDMCAAGQFLIDLQGIKDE